MSNLKKPSKNIDGSDIKRLGKDINDVRKKFPKTPEKVEDLWIGNWSLLVGAWYSLHMALPAAEDIVASSNSKVEAAEALLNRADNELPPRLIDLTNKTSDPWHVGYFLISAEHRICNSLERLVKIFIWADDHRHFFDLCREVSKKCYHGCGEEQGINYLFRFGPSLETFVEGDPRSELSRVWRRVVSLKHHVNLPQIPQQERSELAFKALDTLVIAHQEFAEHWNSCGKIADKLDEE